MTSPAVRDLAALLGAAWPPVAAFLDADVAACRLVSPRRPAGHRLGAFRLDLADGRRVKLRTLRRPEQAATVADVLTEFVDPAFPPVLFRHEHVLLETWVAGTPLAADDERAPGEAGDLLGRLHTWRDGRTHVHGAPREATTSTAADRALLGQQLDELRDADLLTPAAARELARRADRLDPGRTALGLIHGDLCGENMLRDTAGRLVVIDNERLGPGSLAHDLERTRYRWPLSPAGRAAFAAAYAVHRDPTADASQQPFWELRTLVQSAHVRALRWSGDARAPLDALAALLDGVRRPGAASPLHAADRS